MKGNVDEAGRALLELQVRRANDADVDSLVVWVDTAFDGELVIPRDVIEKLDLQKSAAVEAILADGTAVALDTYNCLVQWFGEWREVEVIANDGRLPLLGVSLLQERRLVIDYRSTDLTLT